MPVENGELPARTFGVDPAVMSTFRLDRPDGSVWTVKRLATLRAGGCRYQVFDVDGRLRFDSLDCYNLGNAVNAVERWLGQVEPETPW
jgi:hypothetical protein